VVSRWSEQGYIKELPGRKRRHQVSHKGKKDRANKNRCEGKKYDCHRERPRKAKKRDEPSQGGADQHSFPKKRRRQFRRKELLAADPEIRKEKGERSPAGRASLVADEETSLLYLKSMEGPPERGGGVDIERKLFHCSKKENFAEIPTVAKEETSSRHLKAQENKGLGGLLLGGACNDCVRKDGCRKFAETPLSGGGLRRKNPLSIGNTIRKRGNTNP